MQSGGRTYLAIDLKSFYASVECVERGLDPLDTNLVVADVSRTEKTICLAVSPSLKAYGISGRARLFEAVQRIREVNNNRRLTQPGYRLSGKSISDKQLRQHADMEVDYIAAMPRMALYLDYSKRIYEIYLDFISPDDIHVYSVDEVFIDATDYLKIYHLSAHQLAMKLIREVLRRTGITATAGIGTNMYLAKVAMDIVAKHIPADSDGVRIAELDEMSYRKQLWSHQPLTDFWRVGRGTQRRLEPYGIRTMGDIARMSIRSENFLYRLFGVNAELLIDHAWGWEPCTMQQVKAYRPETSSMSSGQVLAEAYDAKKTEVVLKEMAEALALDMLDKRLLTEQITLCVGYDVANASYQGETSVDRYGRVVPRHAQGTEHIATPTSSVRLITEATLRLFRRIIDPALLVRRITLTACNLISETQMAAKPTAVELDLFSDTEATLQQMAQEKEAIDKERRLMEATLALKKRFGKNSLLRGTSFEEGATARERNSQIGGHRA